MNEIKIFRGQTYSREFTLVTSDGMPYNLTGLTLWFRLFAKSFEDLPVLEYNSAAHATKIQVVAPATAGKFRLNFSASDTDLPERVYSYLVYLTDGAGGLFDAVGPTDFYVVEGGLP